MSYRERMNFGRLLILQPAEDFKILFALSELLLVSQPSHILQDPQHVLQEADEVYPQYGLNILPEPTFTSVVSIVCVSKRILRLCVSMSVTAVMQISQNVLNNLVMDNPRDLPCISNSFVFWWRADRTRVDSIKQRLNAHLNANSSLVPIVKFDISFSVRLSAMSCKKFEYVFVLELISKTYRMFFTCQILIYCRRNMKFP